MGLDLSPRPKLSRMREKVHMDQLQVDEKRRK